MKILLKKRCNVRSRYENLDYQTLSLPNIRQYWNCLIFSPQEAMLKDEEKVSPNRTQKGRIRSRRAILELLLENMAFRHQIAVLERSAKRPQFTNADRLLWVILSTCRRDQPPHSEDTEGRTLPRYHFLCQFARLAAWQWRTMDFLAATGVYHED